MAGFTLYGYPLSGPTYKVGLMLALSGTPFAWRVVNPRLGEHKAPAFLAKNRYGQIPCLEHGGLALNQSAAILQYVAEVTGKLGGDTPEERLRAREWMFWDFDRLAPPIYRMRGIRFGFRSVAQPVAEMYWAEGIAALQVLEGELGRTPFLAGAKPTIGDVDVYGVVRYAPDGGFDLSAFPNVRAWMARIEALPGFAQPSDLLPAQSRD